jgi:hypothetical protein
MLDGSPFGLKYRTGCPGFGCCFALGLGGGSVGSEESILLGVVSGVLTSGVIFLAVTIFNKTLVPWYRSTIYRGLDLSGSWEEEVTHPIATDYTFIVLKQRERDVTGTKTVIKTNHQTATKVTKTHEVRGILQDGTLMLISNNSDRKCVGHGTYLLRAVRGGDVLSGVASWVDIGTGRVESRHCAVRRAKT